MVIFSNLCCDDGSPDGGDVQAGLTIARTVLEDIWGGARQGLLRSSSLSQESSVVQLALRGTQLKFHI
jgi:hypothetical protein